MTKDNSKTRTPIIRFQGFNEEWKKKKIGDISIVLQGYGFPEKYQGQKYGDLPFCKVGDISSAVDRGEMVINKADNFVDYSLLPVLHAQPIPVGSTIFAKIGEAIRSNKRIKTGVPCLIDNNAAAVKSKGEISDTFLFYLMSKVNLADYSGGIVPSVNKSTIEEIDVLVPSSRDEQQRIAECLEAIDQMISAQNQKVESLKAHKKGLMQQLFPQPGATTPALRFPGFTGDWQEKSFDGICHTITPPLKLQSSQYSSSGKFPIVDQSQTLICGWTNDSSGLLRNTPYIIFGDHTCVLKYIDFPFIQGADGVKILGSNKKDNSKFIYQLLLSNPVKQDGYKRHFSDLKEKVFLLPPTLEEQTKIAECLSSIDEIISVEESKVASLKAHKKGLMQQLFPQPEK